jgi:hypothetical protein
LNIPPGHWVCSLFYFLPGVPAAAAAASSALFIFLFQKNGAARVFVFLKQQQQLAGMALRLYTASQHWRELSTQKENQQSGDGA